jgi:amidase/6-aminohexanoate-cyclic-dimer hydrolase
MPFQEYESYDMLGLAQLVRERAVSAGEVLSAALDRIARLNPRFNAVTFVLEDPARRQIAGGLPAGPLSGVPYLMKDLYQLYAGAPVSNGSRLFDGFVADHDSTLVERLKAAGIVIVGRSNTPEFGLNATTEPSRFGPTRNPWKPTHSAGGSSGGASAAVAAGMVPAAHATDGGGSIRIPASHCGLFGLKATRGRNPAGPDVGEGWSGLAVGHAVTHSVRDSAALLDATSGPAPGDPYWAPPRKRPFVEEVGADPGRLRIALNVEHPAGGKVSSETRGAAEVAAKLLEGLGHHVEPAAPALDFEAALRAIRTIIAANLAAAIGYRLASLGRKKLAPGDVENITALWAEEGRRLTAADYAGAITTVHGIGRRFGAFFQHHDVLLSPVVAGPPVPLGTFDMMSKDLDAYFAKLFDYVCFTGQFNFSGGPAASVPFHWTTEGLPVGVHIGADLGNEAVLFRLASQIEAVRPWRDRRPTL